MRQTMSMKKMKSRKLVVWIITVALATAAYGLSGLRSPSSLTGESLVLYLRLLAVLAVAYIGGNEASKLIKSVFYKKELDKDE